MKVYQYCCENADGDAEIVLDKKDEAIEHAKKNKLRVVELEFEYSDSRPVEDADFTEDN
jgi:hypothetical protein